MEGYSPEPVRPKPPECEPPRATEIPGVGNTMPVYPTGQTAMLLQEGWRYGLDRNLHPPSTNK